MVLDLGRQPEARFQGIPAGEYLREHEVTAAGECCAVLHVMHLSAMAITALYEFEDAAVQPPTHAHETAVCQPGPLTDLEAAVAAVGDFGADNRAGVPGTLHRISAIRNRRGAIIGLTCRVGRAVSGHIAMLKDLVESESVAGGCNQPGS